MNKQLSRLVALLLFALVSFGCVPATLAEPANEPKHIILTWTDDPQTTQTITWQTDAAANGQLMFAERAGSLSYPAGANTLAAVAEVLMTNKGTRYIHRVTIQGLKPGKHYSYQVGDGMHWSEPHDFYTEPSQNKPYQFLIFGDSQSKNYSAWRATLQAALERHPHAAFMTNVGDLVDVGQDYAQWDAWFSAAGNGALPVMPVTGNHETYTTDRAFSKPTLFTTQFSLPQNGPDALKGQVYSFDYGDVHFVVLDSQEGEQRQFIPDLIEQQKTWLDKDLSQTKKQWKIIFVHRPPYSNRAFRDNAEIRKAFVPLFDKHHVDLVFTGHDHVYARTYPLTNGRVTPGGTVYVASGRSGTKTYRLVAANPLNEFFYNPSDEPNYLHVEVMPDYLTISAFKQSGTLIETWILSKAASTQKVAR